MFTNKKTIRLIAGLTLSCFIYSFVLYEPLLGVTTKIKENKQINELKEKLYGLHLPSNYGRIVRSKHFDNDNLIIYIQDLHCNPEVQRNIFNVIKFFDNNSDINKIFIEGAPCGKVDTSLLKSIPEGELRKNLLDAMLSNGMIDGGAYFSITENKDSLYGIEDWDKYTANLQRINKLYELKENNIKISGTLINRINLMKRKFSSRRVLKLEKYFQNRNEKTEKYYLKLEKLGKKSKEPVNNYPNLHKYIQITKLKKKIKYKHLASELRSYLNELKQKLPFSIYQKLTEKLNKKEKLEEFYASLYDIAKNYNHNIEDRFPNVCRFLNYTHLNQSINPFYLIKEERTFTHQILLLNSTELIDKELLFLSEMAVYFDNLVQLKLSADEYEHFVKNKDKFKILLRKYLNSYETIPVLNLLQNEDIFAYYDTNLHRNDVFIKNIGQGIKKNFKPETANKDTLISLSKLKNFKTINMLIAGGFHSDITEKFEENNISYISITPNITKEFDEDFYEQVITGKTSLQEIAQSSLKELACWLQDPTPAKETLLSYTYEHNFLTFIMYVLDSAVKCGYSHKEISEQIQELKSKLIDNPHLQSLNMTMENEELTLSCNETTITIDSNNRINVETSDDLLPGETKTNIHSMRDDTVQRIQNMPVIGPLFNNLGTDIEKNRKTIRLFIAAVFFAPVIERTAVLTIFWRMLASPQNAVPLLIEFLDAHGIQDTLPLDELERIKGMEKVLKFSGLAWNFTHLRFLVALASVCAHSVYNLEGFILNKPLLFKHKPTPTEEKIPVAELVREPTDTLSEDSPVYGSKLNRENYQANSYKLREKFLELLPVMAELSPDDPESIRIVRDYFRSMHSILLLSHDKFDTEAVADPMLYYFPLSLLVLGEPSPEERVSGNSRIEDIEERAGSSTYAIENYYSDRFFYETLLLLKKLYSLQPDTPIPVVLDTTFEFYLHLIGAKEYTEGSRPYIFVNGSNSFAMNLVNTLLNSYGLNGISHGYIDKLINYDGAPNIAEADFVNRVDLANPGKIPVQYIKEKNAVAGENIKRVIPEYLRPLVDSPYNRDYAPHRDIPTPLMTLNTAKEIEKTRIFGLQIFKGLVNHYNAYIENGTATFKLFIASVFFAPRYAFEGKTIADIFGPEVTFNFDAVHSFVTGHPYRGTKLERMEQYEARMEGMRAIYRWMHLAFRLTHWDFAVRLANVCAHAMYNALALYKGNPLLMADTQTEEMKKQLKLEVQRRLQLGQIKPTDITLHINKQIKSIAELESLSILYKRNPEEFSRICYTEIFFYYASQLRERWQDDDYVAHNKIKSALYRIPCKGGINTAFKKQGGFEGFRAIINPRLKAELGFEFEDVEAKIQERSEAEIEEIAQRIRVTLASREKGIKAMLLSEILEQFKGDEYLQINIVRACSQSGLVLKKGVRFRGLKKWTEDVVVLDEGVEWQINSHVERLQNHYFQIWKDDLSAIDKVIIEIISDKGALTLQELTENDELKAYTAQQISRHANTLFRKGHLKKTHAFMPVPKGKENRAKRHPVYGSPLAAGGDIELYIIQRWYDAYDHDKPLSQLAQQILEIARRPENQGTPFNAYKLHDILHQNKEGRGISVTMIMYALSEIAYCADREKVMDINVNGRPYVKGKYFEITSTTPENNLEEKVRREMYWAIVHPERWSSDFLEKWLNLNPETIARVNQALSSQDLSADQEEYSHWLSILPDDELNKEYRKLIRDDYRQFTDVAHSIETYILMGMRLDAEFYGKDDSEISDDDVMYILKNLKHFYVLREVAKRLSPEVSDLPQDYFMQRQARDDKYMNERMYAQIQPIAEGIATEVRTRDIKATIVPSHRYKSEIVRILREIYGLFIKSVNLKGIEGPVTLVGETEADTDKYIERIYSEWASVITDPIERLILRVLQEQKRELSIRELTQLINDSLPAKIGFSALSGRINRRVHKLEQKGWITTSRKKLPGNTSESLFARIKDTAELPGELPVALSKNLVEMVVRAAVPFYPEFHKWLCDQLGVDGLEGLDLQNILVNEPVILANAVFELFEEGAQQGFPVNKEYALLVRAITSNIAAEFPGMIVSVKLSRNPALIQEDAWSLSTIKVDKQNNEVTVYIHELFLNELNERGPPEEFIELVPYGTLPEVELAKALGTHEAIEWKALNDETSKIYEYFGAYLKPKYGDDFEKYRTSQEFHEYLRFHRQTYPRQTFLYEFSEQIVDESFNISRSLPPLMQTQSETLNSLIYIIRVLGLINDIEKIKVEIDKEAKRNTVRIEGETLVFALNDEPDNMIINDLASPLEREPTIRERLKNLIPAIDSLYVLPDEFKDIKGDHPDAAKLVRAIDFSAINVVLPTRLAGGGDIGITRDFALVLREMFPNKKIRVFMYNKTFEYAVNTEFIEGDENAESIDNEINGITYINGDKVHKLDYMETNDLTFVFPVAKNDTELAQRLYEYRKMGANASQTIVLKDPGMLTERLGKQIAPPDPFGQRLVEPDIDVTHDGKRNSNVIGLWSPPGTFQRSVQEYLNSSRTLQLLRRQKLLDDLGLSSESSQLCSRNWGIVYTHEVRKTPIYLDLFARAHNNQNAGELQQNVDEFRENGAVLFIGTGRNSYVEEETINKIKKLQEQDKLNARVIKLDSKTGKREVIFEGKDSNVEIIIFDFIKPELFDKAFIFSDDLPSLVGGAVTLAYQYYISSITGRPFLFTQAFWQDNLAWGLRKFAEMCIPEHLRKYIKNIFDCSFYARTPEHEYETASELFYNPETREVFRHFTKQSLTQFSFRDRLTSLIEHVKTMNLESPYGSHSFLLRAIAALRKQKGFVVAESEELEVEVLDVEKTKGDYTEDASGKPLKYSLRDNRIINAITFVLSTITMAIGISFIYSVFKYAIGFSDILVIGSIILIINAISFSVFIVNQYNYTIAKNVLVKTAGLGPYGAEISFDIPSGTLEASQLQEIIEEHFKDWKHTIDFEVLRYLIIRLKRKGVRKLIIKYIPDEKEPYTIETTNRQKEVTIASNILTESRNVHEKDRAQFEEDRMRFMDILIEHIGLRVRGYKGFWPYILKAFKRIERFETEQSWKDLIEKHCIDQTQINLQVKNHNGKLIAPTVWDLAGMTTTAIEQKALDRRRKKSDTAKKDQPFLFIEGEDEDRDINGTAIARAIYDIRKLADSKIIEDRDYKYDESLKLIGEQLGGYNLKLFNPDDDFVQTLVNRFTFIDVLLIDPESKTVYINRDFWEIAIGEKGELERKERRMNTRIIAILAMAAASVQGLEKTNIAPGTRLTLNQESMMRRVGDLYATHVFGDIIHKAIAEYLSITSKRNKPTYWFVSGIRARAPPFRKLILKAIELNAFASLYHTVRTINLIKRIVHAISDSRNRRRFRRLDLENSRYALYDLQIFLRGEIYNRIKDKTPEQIEEEVGVSSKIVDDIFYEQSYMVTASRLEDRESLVALTAIVRDDLEEMLSLLTECLYLRSVAENEPLGYRGAQRKTIMEHIDIVVLSQLLVHLEDVHNDLTNLDESTATLADYIQLALKVEEMKTKFGNLTEMIREKVNDTSKQSPVPGRIGIFRNHANMEDDTVVKEREKIKQEITEEELPREGLYEILERDLKEGKNRTHYVWAAGGGADILSAIRRYKELTAFYEQIQDETNGNCGELKIVILTSAEKRIHFNEPSSAEDEKWKKEQNPLHIELTKKQFLELYWKTDPNRPFLAKKRGVLDLVEDRTGKTERRCNMEEQQQYKAILDMFNIGDPENNIPPQKTLLIKRKAGVIPRCLLQNVDPVVLDGVELEGIVKATNKTRVLGAGRMLDEASVVEMLERELGEAMPDIYLVTMENTVGDVAKEISKLLRSESIKEDDSTLEESSISLEMYEHGGDAVALMHAGHKDTIVSPNNEKFATQVIQMLKQEQITAKDKGVPGASYFFTLSGLGNDFESYFKWIGEVFRYLLKHEVITEIIAPWAPGVLEGAQFAEKVLDKVTSYANRRGLGQITGNAPDFERSDRNAKRLFDILRFIAKNKILSKIVEKIMYLLFFKRRNGNMFQPFVGYPQEGRITKRDDFHGTISFAQKGQVSRFTFVMPFERFAAYSDIREQTSIDMLSQDLYSREETKHIKDNLSIKDTSPKRTIGQIGESFIMLGVTTEEGKQDLTAGKTPFVIPNHKEPAESLTDAQLLEKHRQLSARIQENIEDNPMVITIDGPSAAGKSPLAMKLAQDIGCEYMDAGVFYRTITLLAIERKIDTANKKALVNLVKEYTEPGRISITFKQGELTVSVDGRDVSSDIREPEVENIVAAVSDHKKVVEEIMKLQRSIIEQKLKAGRSLIIEGRNMGTDVYQKAAVKIYLDASLEERASRRYNEFKESGYDITYKEVLEEIRSRDFEDTNRKYYPLRKAPDAAYIDSTNHTHNKTIYDMLKIIMDYHGMKAALMQAEKSAERRSSLEAHVGASIMDARGNIIAANYNDPDYYLHAEFMTLINVFEYFIRSINLSPDDKEKFVKQLESIRENGRMDNLKETTETARKNIETALIKLRDEISNTKEEGSQEKAGNVFKDITIYLTLSPCNSCAEFIKALGIQRVVIGHPSVNHKHKGSEYLIEKLGKENVRMEVLLEECKKVSRFYLFFAKHLPLLASLLQKFIISNRIMADTGTSADSEEHDQGILNVASRTAKNTIAPSGSVLTITYMIVGIFFNNVRELSERLKKLTKLGVSKVTAWAAASGTSIVIGCEDAVKRNEILRERTDSGFNVLAVVQTRSLPSNLQIININLDDREMAVKIQFKKDENVLYFEPPAQPGIEDITERVTAAVALDLTKGGILSKTILKGYGPVWAIEHEEKNQYLRNVVEDVYELRDILFAAWDQQETRPRQNITNMLSSLTETITKTTSGVQNVTRLSLKIPAGEKQDIENLSSLIEQSKQSAVSYIINLSDTGMLKDLQDKVRGLEQFIIGLSTTDIDAIFKALETNDVTIDISSIEQPEIFLEKIYREIQSRKPQHKIIIETQLPLKQTYGFDVILRINPDISGIPSGNYNGILIDISNDTQLEWLHDVLKTIRHNLNISRIVINPTVQYVQYGDGNIGLVDALNEVREFFPEIDALAQDLSEHRIPPELEAAALQSVRGILCAG
ncbi:MAG: (d)CMP kinase [Endomicrobiales bacterium]|nr:(d)CMP kinase [Endomicrobiales bacterium]